MGKKHSVSNPVKAQAIFSGKIEICILTGLSGKWLQQLGQVKRMTDQNTRKDSRIKL
jgi:hypothetical protein